MTLDASYLIDTDPLLTLDALSPPPWRRFAVELTPQRTLVIPDFAGSMLRGALGHALKKLYCPCSTMPQHLPECLYARLFENNGQPGFVVTPPPPGYVPAGKSSLWHVTLMDVSAATERALLAALDRAACQGLGVERVRCHVSAVHHVPWTLTPLDQSVTLEFTSPWLIKVKGRPLMAKDVKPVDALLAIAQRQRRFMADTACQTKNLPLLKFADQLHYSHTLCDVDGQRRSQRQGKRHPLCGVRGSITLTHPYPGGLRPLTGLLHRARWLHAGGKTSFGMGALALRVPSPPTPSLPGLSRRASS